MNVVLPDGTRLTGIPDGTSKATILAKLKGNGYDIRPLLQAETERRADPTADMSGPEKFLAGTGKAFVDLGRGVKQFFGSKQADEDIAESRRLEAPLMNTGAGLVGNLVGNVAALAPTAFIPGVNSLAGAALSGTAMGGLAPVAPGESRGFNAAIGAGAGVAGRALGAVTGRLLRPVADASGAETAALAQAAAREKIPLAASQITQSKPLATVESLLEKLPFTASRQGAIKETQKEAFNAAVLRRTGITGNKATPAALGAQKAALGEVFEDIASRNSIDFEKGVATKLAAIKQEASRRLAKPEPVTNTVDDIVADLEGGTVLTGTKYQGWREVLGRMARGTDSEAHYAGQVKKTLDRAFSDQIGKADAAAWKTASRQYGNLKTVARAMGGAGPDSVVGNISPAQLSAALSNQVGREGKALGRGDLNELSKLGRAFVSESVPDSGTAQRTFYQNMLTGNLGGAGLGAGAGYYAGGPEGAAVGALGGAGLMLGLPRAVQAALNSRAGQRYLTRGLVPINANWQRRLPLVSQTGLLGYVAGQEN